MGDHVHDCSGCKVAYWECDRDDCDEEIDGGLCFDCVKSDRDRWKAEAERQKQRANRLHAALRIHGRCRSDCPGGGACVCGLEDILLWDRDCQVKP